jgi:hypothetical protein
MKKKYKTNLEIHKHTLIHAAQMSGISMDEMR